MYKKFLSIISLAMSPIALIHMNALAEETTHIKCLNKNQQSFWLVDKSNPGLIISVSGHWNNILEGHTKFRYFVINGGKPMIEALANACAKFNPNFKYISAGVYQTNDLSLFAINDNTFYNSFMKYSVGHTLPMVFSTVRSWQEREMKIKYDLELPENKYLTKQQIIESIAESNK
ncbi:hypothetical protein [Fluviispira vulneris]|uniref:hypothetical protein n=1 Tax=Fluviispira vulneris TaxID=2763012 RepID=UPI001645DAD9|nr:hypothetical protein [Fluviispira vulneris]